MTRKIRLLVIGIWEKDRAYSQLRLVGPLGSLPKSEFDVTYVSTIKAIVTLPIVPDVIVAGRTPFEPAVRDRIRRFSREMKIPIVVDIDDLLTEVPSEHREYARHVANRVALEEHLRSANAITVTTNALKEELSVYNRNIHVLPNLIDQRIWERPGLCHPAHTEKTVIGFAGTPTHDYDFASVVPAIRYVLEKYRSRVMLKLIGCVPAGLSGIKDIQYIAPTRSYTNYARMLQQSNFDIAIAPLADNRFNKCKSNIKFLEYSICRYAGVYSDIDPYRDSTRTRDTGMVVSNTTEAWVTALELLINDRELRSRIGSNAQDYVKANYSINKGLELWHSFYRDIGCRSCVKQRRFSFEPIRAYGGHVIYDARCKWTSWIERHIQ